MKIIIKKVSVNVVIEAPASKPAERINDSGPKCGMGVIGPFRMSDIRSKDFMESLFSKVFPDESKPAEGESFTQYLQRLRAQARPVVPVDDKPAEKPVQDDSKAAVKDDHWNPAAEACGL